MGCSSQQIVKTEYIKQYVPELPTEPNYYSVKWNMLNMYYCLDLENAKNLLKNYELMRGYQVEMRTILERLKEEK